MSDGSSFSVSANGPNGIPDLALLIRNIVLGAEQVMSHITHFYALAALDYVQGPPIAPWQQEWNVSYYGDAAYGGGGNPVYAGITRPLGYAAGPPYFQASPIDQAITEINESLAFPGLLPIWPLTGGPGIGSAWGVIILDYVLALHMRRFAHEAAASLCGGLPHARNWVPGGVTYRPSAGDFAKVGTLLSVVEAFIATRYQPLTEILARLYPSWDNVANTNLAPPFGLLPPAGGLNLGAGYGNFLSYGVYNEQTGTPVLAEGPAKRLLKRGTALGGGLPSIGIIQTLISEHVERSWYEDSTDALHPSVGVTDPVAPPKTNKAAGYSWLKAPRYGSKAMEVGPLARMWVDGSYSPLVPLPQGAIHSPFAAPGYLAAVLPGLGVSAAIISGNPVYTPGISVMDRHRARCLDGFKVIQRITGSDGNLDGGWLNQAGILAANPANAIVGTKSLPAEGATGYGLNEAPRGALGHWLTMKSAGRVERYQCVVPTTWNGSPRVAHAGVDARGPIEEALCAPVLPLSGVNSSGEYVPVEGLRVVHSFDVCVACSVHVIDATKGKKIAEYEGKMAQLKIK